MATKGGAYATTTVGEEVLAASTVAVSYVPVGTSGDAATATVPAQQVLIRLAPGVTDPAVPGSVQFAWMGHTYVDADGILYRDRTPSDPGIESGTMDYNSITAMLDDWAVGPDPQTVTVQRLWTRKQRWTSGIVYGRTLSAPIRPGGLALTVTDMTGGNLVANVDNNGAISGDHCYGSLDFASGTYQIMFGDYVTDASLSPADKAEWWYSAGDVGEVEAGKIWRPWPVDPTTLRYNAVSYVYLPVDAELLGMDPVRLPADGRVVIFRPGEYAVVGLNVTSTAFAPTNGQTYDTGHERLSVLRVLGLDGEAVEEGFTVDLDAGTVTFDDITGWPAQVVVRARVEVYRRIAEVRLDGTIRFTEALGTAFPSGAVVSSALRAGDLFARVERTFDQLSWSGTTWPDSTQGDQAVASYDTTGYPIEVSNRGAITEKFALRFTSSSTFVLIGEHLGQIAAGSINEDFAPINPASGAPYMTIRAAGWGLGWISGNVLFVHTVGAQFDVAVIRATQPGPPSAPSYRAELEARGDVDTPPSDPFA